MLATVQVSNALQAATALAEKLPKGLTKRVYHALLIPAVENARVRGYINPSRVTYHCPAEIIAAALGISRMSLWRAVQQLKDLGLVDNRAHKGTCRGQTRNTGSVWQVRLTPNHGSRCKLSYEELKHSWRPNFDREIRRGRGSYQAVRAAKLHTKEKTQELDLDLLLRFAVDKTFQPNPVDTSVCNTPKNAVLETLLDVTAAKPGKATVQMVDMAALALATALADHGSVNFYRLLVWRCLRAAQQGLDVFPRVYQMAVRARVDVQENFSRRGGAVFVSRLREAEFYEWVTNTPPKNQM